MRERIKWLLFPGINLHTRQRYRILPRCLESAAPGGACLLDAGCGNGMLSYRACLKGYQVTGISFKEGEVARCRKLFNGYLGIPEERLQFKVMNLYDVEALNQQYDQIICTEVLEHLMRDEAVCRSLFALLKPNGVIHICCPNADHPYNRSFPLDPGENGGHVRAGYTYESYRRLLEPIGFRIVGQRGLGGPVRQFFNSRIKRLQEKYGDVVAFPLFLLSFLFLWLDREEARVPYTLYVKAVKPA